MHLTSHVWHKKAIWVCQSQRQFDRSSFLKSDVGQVYVHVKCALYDVRFILHGISIAISYGETCEFGASIHEAAVCHRSYYVGPPRYECQKIILREKTIAPIETKLSIPSRFHRNQQNSLYQYTNKNEKLLLSFFLFYLFIYFFFMCENIY